MAMVTEMVTVTTMETTTGMAMGMATGMVSTLALEGVGSTADECHESRCLMIFHVACVESRRRHTLVNSGTTGKVEATGLQETPRKIPRHLSRYVIVPCFHDAGVAKLPTSKAPFHSQVAIHDSGRLVSCIRKPDM